MAALERPSDIMTLASCPPVVGDDDAMDLPPELVHRLYELCMDQIHETSLRVHCFYLVIMSITNVWRFLAPDKEREKRKEKKIIMVINK